jgi:hypothetical protein
MNGVPSSYSYSRTSPHQHYQTNSIPSNSLSTNLLQHLIRQKADMLNQDLYLQHPSASSFDESTHYTPSSNFSRSPSKTKEKKNIGIRLKLFPISF